MCFYYSDMPTINVWQIPDGNLKENDAVSLTCDAGPDIRIYWVHKGKVIQSPIVNIESVDKTHTGRYTCIADSGEGRRVAKDLFLHVVCRLLGLSSFWLISSILIK